MEGQTDTTVAIVAIAITGLVGVLGPTIAGLFGLHRQREQLDFDRAQERREALRETLGRASALIQEQIWSMSPGSSDLWTEEASEKNRRLGALARESVLHNQRMLLWLTPEDLIVKAYGRTVTAIIDLAVYDAKDISEGDRDTRHEERESLFLALTKAHMEYLAAARAVVNPLSTGSPAPPPRPRLPEQPPDR